MILQILQILFTKISKYQLRAAATLYSETADLRERSWSFKVFQSSATQVKIVSSSLSYLDSSYPIFFMILGEVNFFFSGLVTGPTYQPPVWHSNPNTPLLVQMAIKDALTQCGFFNNVISMLCNGFWEHWFKVCFLCPLVEAAYNNKCKLLEMRISWMNCCDYILHVPFQDDAGMLINTSWTTFFFASRWCMNIDVIYFERITYLHDVQSW